MTVAHFFPIDLNNSSININHKNQVKMEKSTTAAKTAQKKVNLNQVKTVNGLRKALNGQSLVMYTSRTHNDANGRISTERFVKLYVIKFDEKGKMLILRTVSPNFRYWADIVHAINEDYVTPKNEEAVLRLFIYNRNKGAQMFVVDSFLPQHLKHTLQLQLEAAASVLTDAKMVITQMGVEKTKEYIKSIRRIPLKLVALHNDRPSFATTFKIRKHQYSVMLPPGEKLIVHENGHDGNYDQIRDIVKDNKWSLYALSNRHKKELLKFYRTAASIQDNVKTMFTAWFKTLPYSVAK